MAKKITPKKTIKFRYIFDRAYNPKYSNGAYGGLTVRGEIVMNFYQERMPLPNEQVHQLGDDNKLGELISSDPPDIKNTVVRIVENGVIFDLQTAKETRDWLNAKISELESRLTDGRNPK